MSAYLVRKPRRKRHLAGSHGAEWWTVCDRIVEGADVEAIAVGDVDVDALEARAGEMCVECRRMILLAGVVHAFGVARLVASLEVAA